MGTPWRDFECFTLFFLSLGVVMESVVTSDDLVVQTVSGWIRGKVVEGVKGEKESMSAVGTFLGVPYAEPPIRELRFRAPKSLPSWTGVLNCTNFGAICWQPGEQRIYDAVPLRNKSSVRKRKLENYVMDEDCLTLNIYVPLSDEDVLDPRRKLPVFFYIHGGSYYMGAGRLYPGQILAAKQQIIVVTFNFRLGPLGFLSTEDLSAPGNWGLLDQAAALDWVHHNIHFFGGSAERVSLAGNSAGAASVMFHLVSRLSVGKFVSITVQSGCSAAPWAVQLFPRRHAVDLAKKLGCPTAPTSDLVDCIRTFPPKTILKNANLEDGLSLAYAAVVDGAYGGKFLSAHPDTLIQQNHFHHVPVLAGFTKDEVTIWFTKWGPSSPTKHLKDFLEHDVLSLIRNLPTLTEANHAAAIHAVKVQYLYRYGIQDNDTLGKTSAVSDFISDVGLKAPCIQEMNLLARFSTAPLFLYEFDYFSVDDIRMNRQEWIGSYHESELQFIFGEAYLNYSNHLRAYDDKKMSDLLMRLWADFAKYGYPTVADREKIENFHWTNYTQENQDYAVIGLKTRMEKYFYTDRMLFWNYFFPIFRDYVFTLETPVQDCSTWEIVQVSWVLWVLAGVVGLLVLLLASSCTCRLRKKSHCRIPNSSRKPRPHRNSFPTIASPNSAPSAQNSASCRNSLVLHAHSPCSCNYDDSE